MNIVSKEKASNKKLLYYVKINQCYKIKKILTKLNIKDIIIVRIAISFVWRHVKAVLDMEQGKHP